MALGDFPLNFTLHPQGRFAAVLHCGHGRHELAVVDLEEAKVVSRAPVPEAFYGLEFSRSGARLYCSGAADEVIHVFDFKDGKLQANQRVPLRDARQRGIPCGLAVWGRASKFALTASKRIGRVARKAARDGCTVTVPINDSHDFSVTDRSDLETEQCPHE